LNPSVPLPSLRRNGSFWLLAIGQGFSRLGDGLYAAALAWTAWSIGGTPQAIAAVLLASTLPGLAFSIVGASYADRYDRRRLMIGCDVVRALLVAPLPLLLRQPGFGLTGLALVAALVAAAGAPFAPARNAIVPQVVGTDSLVAANGLLQASFNSSFFVGPLFLAPLLPRIGLPGVFAVDAATFLISIATLTGVRVVRSEDAREPLGLRADLAAGFRVLRQAADVQIVLGTFVLGILFASGFLLVGVPTLVGTRLGGNGGDYGLLLGIAGLAEVAGALLLSRVRLPRLALSAVLPWILLGLFRSPLGLVSALPEAAGLLTVTGLCSAFTDIPLIALVQERIPDRHRAKVLGLWETGLAGSLAVSPLVAAFVLDHLGLAAGFAMSGAAMFALGLGAAALLRGSA
jgi:MFS family permease